MVAVLVFMQSPVHAAVSSVGGLLVWSLTGEPWAVLVSMASGVLIDADYFLNNTKCVSKIFHAWEWCLILGLLVVFMDFPWWGLAAATGYGLHIVSDQMSHHRGYFWYFISFRVWVLRTRNREDLHVH